MPTPVTPITPELQLAFDQAKLTLMSKPDATFFITVYFSLKHHWDDSIPTACTNGTSIRFSPQFFLSLHPEERVFLMLHEALHCAYLHMDRLHDRNPARWNVAADHVINLQLIARGYRMPPMGLADPQYKDLNTEAVYAMLPVNGPYPGDMDLQAPEGPTEALQEAMQEILVRAQVASRMANDKPGSIPGEIEIFLDKLLNPKLPWHRILQKYLHSLSKSDYSFQKPNRRFFPAHLLPSLHSEKLMDITFAVDVSGSVSNADFLRFISEIHGVLKMMQPDKINLIQFDTSIRSVHVLKTVRELRQTAFHGRGGTAIEPVMQWAKDHKPGLLVIFTDGEFDAYEETPPKSPVLWLIHANPGFEASYGKTITYEV